MLGPRPGFRAATQTKPTARKLEGLAYSVLGAQSALLAAGAWGGAEVGATGSTAPLTLILAPLRNGPENPTPWTDRDSDWGSGAQNLKDIPGVPWAEEDARVNR